ncbi:hypothetical protein FRC09_020595 [Ceratobasidium sp. 395]|nr:hypothetical protein FRC09_020595 [Ceratobasidium sp. 395]
MRSCSARPLSIHRLVRSTLPVRRGRFSAAHTYCGRTTCTRPSLVVPLGLPLGADEMPDRTPEPEHKTYRAHKGPPGVGRGRPRYVLDGRELVRRFVQAESPVRVALIAMAARYWYPAQDAGKPGTDGRVIGERCTCEDEC